MNEILLCADSWGFSRVVLTSFFTFWHKLPQILGVMRRLWIIFELVCESRTIKHATPEGLSQRTFFGRNEAHLVADSITKACEKVTKINQSRSGALPGCRKFSSENFTTTALIAFPSFRDWVITCSPSSFFVSTLKCPVTTISTGNQVWIDLLCVCVRPSEARFHEQEQFVLVY